MSHQPFVADLYVAPTPDALSCPVSIQDLHRLVEMHVPQSEIVRDLELRRLECPLQGASERSLLLGEAKQLLESHVDDLLAS